MTNFLNLRNQLNKELMSKNRTDDFFPLFPLLPLFHKNSIFDKHFKGGSDNISFDIRVLIGIFVKIFNEIRTDKLKDCFVMNVTYRHIKMRINLFK